MVFGLMAIAVFAVPMGCADESMTGQEPLSFDAPGQDAPVAIDANELALVEGESSDFFWPGADFPLIGYSPYMYALSSFYATPIALEVPVLGLPFFHYEPIMYGFRFWDNWDDDVNHHRRHNDDDNRDDDL